jgi:hypothetical protein
LPRDVAVPILVIGLGSRPLAPDPGMVNAGSSFHRRANAHRAARSAMRALTSAPPKGDRMNAEPYKNDALRDPQLSKLTKVHAPA